MSLDARRALRGGYDGLTSASGYNVFSVLLVFYIAYDAVRQSFRQQLLATAPGVQPPPGFTAVTARKPTPSGVGGSAHAPCNNPPVSTHAYLQVRGDVDDAFHPEPN